MQAEIEKAIRMRGQAKSLEDEAKLLKDGANDILAALMPTLNLEKYSLEGVGTVILGISEGSSVNRQKLIENLLGVGLATDTITHVIRDSSSFWEKEMVKFVRAK